MTVHALRTRPLAATLSLALAAGAAAQDCTPTVSRSFASADLSGAVNAVAIFDDGSGPALYVGGAFTSASGATVNRIAKWDGLKWSALGTGMSGNVNAMVVHDEDGAGPIAPALFIGGAFTTANGVTVNRIARWNGTQFSPVTTGGADSTVLSLLSTTVNGVPHLYVGGSFNNIGGVAASRVADYAAGSWSALGAGVNGNVNALAYYEDQAGPAIYAAGQLTTAGGLPANRIARWDGAQWTTVGDGLGGEVKALHVHTDATGTNLYAAGSFTTAGAISANRIARWDGMQWSELAAGLASTVNAMTSFDGQLYVTGSFTTAGGAAANRIAAFDGQTWTAVQAGLSGNGNAFSALDLGDGPELIVGGAFSTAGDSSASNLARWDGDRWTDLGRGANDTVTAIGAFGGEAIIAGNFTRMATERATRIAGYDGQTFAPIGDGFNVAPKAIVSFDPDNGGPAEPMLIAAGNFTQTGSGNSLSRLARWDGTLWNQIGTTVNGSINSAVVFDDGSGPAVFLAGAFTSIGGVSANRVAKWDGASFAALGAGLGSTVNQLVIHNGGLYAVGTFTTSGTATVNRVARWNGAAWEPLGLGANNTVNTAASYNGQLYVGGTFTSIGGISTNRMGRWDGNAWNDVAGGAAAAVKSMMVYNDGQGEALFVGGDFTGVGAPLLPANRIARFDGAWAAVGAGADGAVETMGVVRLNGKDTLLIGGAFRNFDGVSSDRIAALEPCTQECYANCDGSTTPPALNVNDFICFQQKYAAGDPVANCDASTTPPTLNVNDFICFQQKYAAGCP